MPAARARVLEELRDEGTAVSLGHGRKLASAENVRVAAEILRGATEEARVAAAEQRQIVDELRTTLAAYKAEGSRSVADACLALGLSCVR